MNDVNASGKSRSTWRRSLKDNLMLLSLLLIPSKQRAHAVYEVVSTDNLLTEKSLYLNLGYWKDSPRGMDEACEAMATLLAETARLTKEDRVLDVGFGFGDQDIFWMDRFSPKEIVGLNVTRSQVETARRRVAARGLADRVDLRLGSATEVPFAANSFDKVLALECAFHFPTRDRFFREAYRVLRPGGRIAMTDIIPMPREGPFGLKGRLIEYIGRAFWQISRENVYARDVYRERLIQMGFENVEVISIHDDVMIPFARHSLQRMSEPEVAQRMNPVVRAMFMGSGRASLEQPTDTPVFDYVLAYADKPLG
jgi:erythromycin 3''-O-methyltransferase